MTGFSDLSSGLLSELNLNRHDTDDVYLQKRPPARNVNVSNTSALMRAVVELKVLQTMTSILHITRTNPVSISDPKSTIRRAIARREKRIAHIVDSMKTDDSMESACEAAPQAQTPAQALRRRGLSPSELLDALASAEEDSHEDERFLRVLSSAASPTIISKLNPLVSGDAAPVVDENAQSRLGGILGDEGGLSSSIPARDSGSVYSSLGRSLSMSNVHSAASVCKVVSAAQYTKIIAEREPQFSVVSHPYSIDSLVAESPRINRSELEINACRQMQSADSFPGEFPISGGLDYSSLATAKHHTRIPSIRTSVRPFSDL